MTPKTDSVAVLREVVAEMREELDASRYVVEVSVEAFRGWTNRLAAVLEAQGEAVAWTMRNAHGERIAMTDDQRAKQPEWVLRKWANAAPLYLHPSLEAQASAPGGEVADDARRWAFYVHAMTDESGIAREAIRRQAFPAHTKEAWDACIDKAMAEVVLPEAANEAALAARTGEGESDGR